MNQSSEVETQEGNDQEVQLYLVQTNRMYTRNIQLETPLWKALNIILRSLLTPVELMTRDCRVI